MKTLIDQCFPEQGQVLSEITIMKSLLMEIETLKPRLCQGRSLPGGAISREAWFDEVRPIVFEIVRYGQFIESKYSGLTHMYGPLITQVDSFASSLWNSVTFRARSEIEGKVHWSIAPRNPDAGVEKMRLASSLSVVETLNEIPLDLAPNYSYELLSETPQLPQSIFESSWSTKCVRFHLPDFPDKGNTLMHPQRV